METNTHHFGTLASSEAAEPHRVLRNTYGLLGLSMVPTAIGAVIGTTLLAPLLFKIGMLTSAIVFLIVAFGMMYAIQKNRDNGLGVALLLGFTFFMGLWLGPLLSVALQFRNGGQLIAMAAGGTGAIFFTLAGLSRSLLATYLGVVALLVLWIISQVMLQDVENQFAASLVDPFGLSSLALDTRYWTVVERNADLPALTLGGGTLLLNRLIWSAVGLAIFFAGSFAFDPARQVGHRADHPRRRPDADQPGQQGQQHHRHRQGDQHLLLAQRLLGVVVAHEADDVGRAVHGQLVLLQAPAPVVFLQVVDAGGQVAPGEGDLGAVGPVGEGLDLAREGEGRVRVGIGAGEQPFDQGFIGVRLNHHRLYAFL